jgi:hypothetical protein
MIGWFHDMTDVLVFWRDFRKNSVQGGALRWHSNACLFRELLPGDRLWLVTSGEALKHEAAQAGFLVAVWQVAQVQPNPDNDPAYPAEDYQYRITASETDSISFEQPVPVDHILRPAGRDKASGIGRFLQGPRKLTDEKVRLLRAAAGPQMAQQWLTGKRQPTESADSEKTPEGSAP